MTTNPQRPPAVEPLLLTTVRVCTFRRNARLTAATGFFFERDARLFLVTSRHVLYDEPAAHFPDRIELHLHTDACNLARISQLSLPLYADGTALWRQGKDGGGAIDVAALELQRENVPGLELLQPFTMVHLTPPSGAVTVGAALLLPGFPLGFYDTLHHLPVVRHATLASSFGLRFQGHGHFLTDARTHRGSSGAPVVMASGEPGTALPWWLLGVHSARMDMGSRDVAQDDYLGLNCAWYADILMTLTADEAPAHNVRAWMGRAPA
jgi:hypothetical protein